MHLNVRTFEGWHAGYDGVASRPSQIYRRSTSTKTIVFVVVASVLALTLTVAFCIIYYRKNRKRSPPLPVEGEQPEPLKPSFFKRLFGSWRPKDQYEQAAGDESDDRRRSHPLNPTRARRNRDVEQARNGQGGQNSAAGAAVDRNTSVRSVMTLPAYYPMARDSEQVLGREGERDGMDVIVDLPTVEDEEALRDQEMETLYQIRVARRQQIAEREERREARREARRRNDSTALEQIRSRTIAANNDTTITDLRSSVDRIKDNRNRSASSVSYADVGIARLDGTRIRANSQESERVGLLSDTGSIAASGHQRERSGSSAVSIDSDFPSPTLTRSRGDSQSITPRAPNGGWRAGSSPDLGEADLGQEAMPPPEYEDVSLDDNRSTVPQDGPPPEYFGPYRSASQATERDLTARQDDAVEQYEELGPLASARGVGSVPQLPSLRIPSLPEIVIQPSSAHPRDGN
ncbi:hypothetical protein G7046_g5063 [Stylonectria norvegica]|nr:hypothetical protein G7046_g5063 [Stylonectria norvegica]